MINFEFDSATGKILSEAQDTEALVDACREYFEIAIGVRRPTESEYRQAALISSERMFGKQEYIPEESVQVLKYPFLERALFTVLERYMKTEYTIFNILSRKTNVVDDTSIPMLRLERLMQRKLAAEGDFSKVLTRQVALFQTFFRMKMGRKDMESVSWEWALKSAYRGENLLNSALYDDLWDVWHIRCNYGHEWRVYPESPSEKVRKGYVKGVQVLTRLLNDELDRVFTEYSSTPLSERLPAHWTRRSRMVSGDGGMHFSIPEMTCSNCEETFDPNSNWRYCPKLRHRTRFSRTSI
jgi:hypothetical protein